MRTKAYCPVAKLLNRYELWDAHVRLKKNWGTVGELKDGERGTVHSQAALAKLKKGEHYRVGQALCFLSLFCSIHVCFCLC